MCESSSSSGSRLVGRPPSSDDADGNSDSISVRYVRYEVRAASEVAAAASGREEGTSFSEGGVAMTFQ